MENKDDLRTILQRLDLGKEEIEVMLQLMEFGGMTVLQVARHTGINRTNSYRLLEGLEKKGFVVREPDSKTTRYSPSSIEFLSSKIEDKKNGLLDAEHLFKLVLPAMRSLYKKGMGQIKVVHYTGRDECRQLVWNSLKAKKWVKSFGYRSLKEAIGMDFLLDWFDECFERKIPQYLIANPVTLEMKNTSDTDSKRKFGYRTRYPKSVVDKLYLRRYFEESELKIVNETFIYNDVFSVLQWDKSQIFGVEIYNEGVAGQQEWVFDFLWKLAKRWEPKAG